jgi:hypothetical protein
MIDPTLRAGVTFGKTDGASTVLLPETCPRQAMFPLEYSWRITLGEFVTRYGL